VDRQWRFTYINERALRYKQAFKNDSELTREELLGKDVWEVYRELVGTTIYHKYHEVMREHKTVKFETRSAVTDRWIELHAYPTGEGISVFFQDITERKLAELELERRTHQQAVVAEMDLRALANNGLQSLMYDSVALVAQTLEVEYAKIVELLPGGGELLLRSGVGFEEGLVGATLGHTTYEWVWGSPRKSSGLRSKTMGEASMPHSRRSTPSRHSPLVVV
jgi:hypothetical protein